MARFWVPRVKLDKNGNLTTWQGKLTGVFDKIKTIGSGSLYYAFYNCTGITSSVSFPALISVGNSGLQHAFYGCTGITSIHFRADAKSIIEAADGYSSKFDASNATIYFDL